MSNPYVAALRDVWKRADSDDRRTGRMWYYAARGELFALAKQYRFSLKRCAYAAAALSNNMEWGANVALLEHVAHVCRAGRPDQARGHFGPCLRKAKAILLQGDFGALSGPKVVPFAAALYGDMTAAVVDRWVWRAAGGRGELTAKRTRDVAAALRALARELRRPVAMVQAVIWVVVRRDDDPTQQPIPF